MEVEGGEVGDEGPSARPKSVWDLGEAGPGSSADCCCCDEELQSNLAKPGAEWIDGSGGGKFNMLDPNRRVELVCGDDKWPS